MKNSHYCSLVMLLLIDLFLNGGVFVHHNENVTRICFRRCGSIVELSLSTILLGANLCGVMAANFIIGVFTNLIEYVVTSFWVLLVLPLTVLF